MADNTWVAFAQAVSWLIGWIYFIAWSLSFYPQPLHNWRRRSTSGQTVDFSCLNIIGFSSYLISTAAFLYSPVIRSQYATRHPLAPEPTVRFNDFTFAVHGTIICFVYYSQFWHRLWRFEEVKGQRTSSIALGIIYVSIFGIIITSVLVSRLKSGEDTPNSWAEIDVIYAFSYIKLLITLIKYIPQAWHNYVIKSTAGWAINMILLDFTGGILSLLQLFIDSALQADWSGISGNPVKFGLSIISLFFDVIFLVQHYILYKEDKGDVESNRSDEREPLLA